MHPESNHAGRQASVRILNLLVTSTQPPDPVPAGATHVTASVIVPPE